MSDFGALPPEINSARMYTGPGPGSMLAAAAAWQSLAEELNSLAASYGSILSTLTSGPWTGVSALSMAAAAAPYVTWLSATGDQAQQAAAQAAAAVSAYETAYTATVPPPMIDANRSLLTTLVATNILGQNTPAIMSTEALYAEMWAQDSAAMYGYAGSSAAASQVTPFTAPPQTTNSNGPLGQVVAAAQSAGSGTATDSETILSSGPQLVSATPQALQSLASPQGLDSLTSTTTGTSTSTSSASMLSELSTPMRMASMPMSMLSRLFTAGSSATAAKAATTAANELGSVRSAGVASSSGVLASTTAGFGGAPTVSAGLGHATSVGPLSVPTAWSGAGPSLSSAGTAMQTGAAPMSAAAHSAVPPMMPVTNLAGRAGSAAPAKFELRPRVIPFTPAAG